MRTSKWLGELDDITNLFVSEFKDLSPDQLNWKPDPKTWSIAQNIDHLIVINSTYYPVIEKVRNKTYKLPWLARFNFLVNFFGTTVLNAVQPDRKKRMKTFPLWEPSKSNIAGDILARFAEHQQQMKKFIEDCEDLIAANTVISSPANRNIVYKLETAFDIITTHERRHLEQAREVLRKIKQ